MATAAAAIVAKARRDVQHHFFCQDAVRPDRAIAFEASKPVQQRQFERMCSRGIIREAGLGLYWLDVVAYDDDLRRRHTAVRAALLILVAALAVGLGLSTALR